MIQHRRHVFHVAGYDPISPNALHRRLLRQLQIFKRTWDVEAAAAPTETAPGCVPNWTLETKGPDWQTRTTFEVLAWDDIISKDVAGSRIIRLARALSAYADLLFTGTLLRYLKANPRYFLFTVVPFLELALLALASWIISFYLSSRLNTPFLLQYGIGAIAGWGLFLLLLEWPGRKWRIYQALDDWILSLDYIRENRVDLENRLDYFAERIAACARDDAIDEIIVVGHSLGATFAVDAMARALDRAPDLERRSSLISIVTVGATIPKCGLHPAAKRIRERISRLARSSFHWAEFQSRADPISFYRFHPVTLTRITDRADRLDGNPVVRRLHIKDMLRPETFKRYRFRVLRLHYQFVSANDRRALYDYFMMICGPIAVSAWAKSELGLLDFFGNAENAALTNLAGQDRSC